MTSTEELPKDTSVEPVLTEAAEAIEEVKVKKERKPPTEKQVKSRENNLKKAMESRRLKALEKQKEEETAIPAPQEIKKEQENDIQEEELPVQQKTSKNKIVKKKIIYEDENDSYSSSSSEEEVVVRRRKPHKKKIQTYNEPDYVDLVQKSARETLLKRLEEDKIRLSMTSLFRGKY